MHVLSERKAARYRKATSLLQVVDVASGETELLKTFDHCIEAPNWLKDGKTLLYNDSGNIYLYDIASGASTKLDLGHCDRCNNDHVLSPDETMLGVSHHTVEDGLSRIYVVPLRGGAPRLVTPIAPSYLHGWSPDGKTLSYCAERNGEYDIYTIAVEGGVETRLTDAPGLDDGAEYSPCGRYIWFNSVRSGNMQIFRMRADGSEQTQMTFDRRNNWFAHVSPDGKLVSYISYDAAEVEPGDHPANKNVEIRLMNADGSQPRTLVKLFGGQGSLNVNSWAPDSRRLAFVSYRI